MYRVRCVRPAGDYTNLFGVTGIVFADAKKMSNPENLVMFYPDNENPIYRSCCYVKHLEILDRKDDN